MKIGIIYGGKSAEHDVSILSARNIYNAMNKKKYKPILLKILKNGRWTLVTEKQFLNNASVVQNNASVVQNNASVMQNNASVMQNNASVMQNNASVMQNNASVMQNNASVMQNNASVMQNNASVMQNTPTSEKHAITFAPESNGRIVSLSAPHVKNEIDVAFPALHGPMGEDGTVQGFMKLANIPFVGSAVLGSAIGMDKDVMKRLLRDSGIPIGKFITLYNDDKTPHFEEIIKTLHVPFFVKPANMGSSVGITKVHHECEFSTAIRKAFSYDVKILLEECIYGRELECAIIGNRNPRASIIGEIKFRDDFYSYNAKYGDEHGASLEIPAHVSDAISHQAQKLAIHTYKVLMAEGLARVDMFLKDNDDIVVNEINTFPGFTENSMYPKLWEASGLPYDALIDTLIQLAIERHTIEQTLKTSHFSQ